MSDITVETTVHIDDEERKYIATRPSLGEARFHSEKKARAFLRRKGLSVKMNNVVKARCPDCPERTEITVYDLGTEPETHESKVNRKLDDFEWMLKDDYHM